MTGPEHYRQAERCIQAVTTSTGILVAGSDVADVLALAQVHATLAHAAAAAMGATDLPAPDWDAWRKIAGSA